jgi:hypothetical protein
MTNQEYLMVDESTNIVYSTCIWDGDTNTWQPPANTLMLITATTPAMVWEPVIVDGKITDYVLTEEIGAGQVEFTWNGTAVVTNLAKPSIPTNLETTGTTTA